MWPHTILHVVKLQKEKAYKYKDHEIFRYRINVPSELVGELHWKEGTELDLKIKGNKLEVSKL